MRLTTSSALLALATVSSATARILSPTDDDYVAALATTNRFCPVQCATEIFQPESTADLAAWMRTERSKHNHITVKGSGHSYGCQSVPRDGGMMIHTALLNKAEVVKRANGTAFARLGAGLNFQDVVPQLNSMGYLMPHGECITVGLAGYHLNTGGHPETDNWSRFYGDQPFLSKMTAVDYDGNVFTIDDKGLTYLDPSPNMDASARNVRKELTQALGDQLELALAQGPSGVEPAASSTLRLMQNYGANLIVATEFEIELVPRSEPDYFLITYPVALVVADVNLVQALVDFMFGVDEEELSCGIVFMTDALPGNVDGISLKCMDWQGRGRAFLAQQVPVGYKSLKRVPYSGFFVWNKDSYGLGWTPQFFVEPVALFNAASGVEKWRQIILAMSRPDSPCTSCMLELNRGPGLYYNDMMCGAEGAGQDQCSDFTYEQQASLLGERPNFYKRNLPSCRANPRWQPENLGYGLLYPLAQQLKQAWDSGGVVDFWLGINHEDNDKACEATHVQEIGATCKAHGITALDLVAAVRNDATSRCAKVYKYPSTTEQNTKCAMKWERCATSLKIIDEGASKSRKGKSGKGKIKKGKRGKTGKCG